MAAGQAARAAVPVDGRADAQIRERLDQLDGDELRAEYRDAMRQVQALLPRLTRTVDALDQHVLARRSARHDAGSSSGQDGTGEL